MAEKNPVNIGVINPFALTEYILNKKVNWDNVDDTPTVMSKALGKSYEELFDPENDSPLYAGMRLNPDDDNMEITSESMSINSILENSIGTPLVNTASDDHKLTDVDFGPDGPQIPIETDIDVGARTIWKDPGDFFEDAAEVTDPVQGALGDCYFIAALSSVAWARTYVIAHRARKTSTGSSFTDMVEFFKDGKSVKIEVTEKLPLRFPGNQYIYCKSSDNGEIWPAVYEKAYAKWRTDHSGDTPNYSSIAGGDPVLACSQLTGLNRKYFWTKNMSADTIWTEVRRNSMSRQTFNPMVAWTYSSGSKSPDKIKYSDANLVANHAYSILGWHYHNRQKFIVLRNPWGRTEGTLNVFTGTWSAYDTPYYRGPGFWNRFAMRSIDGIFAMRTDTFKKYFAGLGLVS